jgi:hypothetical protein
MVLNLSQLIMFSGTETNPAAETQSIGLPAYAQLAQVFAEPLRQFYRDQRLRAVNRDPSTRIIPSGQLVWTTKLSAIYRDFIWTKKLPAVYRDYAKTHASAGR